LNKKEAETLLILTNFLHDLWQGFKAMVLVGGCIVVIRLALQMLGTVATVGIFVALPVLYALLWAALSREAFDSIEKIYNLEKAEDKENDPDNKEDE